jgi:AraC-like DNA-binding protein
MAQLFVLKIDLVKEPFTMHEVIKLVANMDPDNLNEKQNFFIRQSIVSPSPNPIVQPLHRHPFFELIFVTQGQGVMQIDFKDKTIQKGSLFLLSPSQTHLPTITDEFHYYLLRFDLSIFSDKIFFENLSIFNFDALVIEEPSFSILDNLLLNLNHEFYQDKLLKHCSLSNLLKLVLINIQRLLPEVVNAKSETSHFIALNHLIDKNSYKIVNSSEYAKQMKVPIKVLNNAVKEYTGLTCGEYIRSKTLIEAKRLLLYTDKNANEIAYELGFVDTAYFNRFFKREEGVTPIKFRKNSL